MTDKEKEVFFEKLTKGSAASIITQLKHGFQVSPAFSNNFVCLMDICNRDVL